MTWNHFSLIVLCLTFFVSKFHGSELNSFSITSIWSKMNIYSLSLITDFFSSGQFLSELFWCYNDLNHRCYIGLEWKTVKLSSIWDQSGIYNWSQRKTAQMKKISNQAQAVNIHFTSNWCYGQTIQLRSMKFWHKKTSSIVL